MVIVLPLPMPVIITPMDAITMLVITAVMPRIATMVAAVAMEAVAVMAGVMVLVKVMAVAKVMAAVKEAERDVMIFSSVPVIMVIVSLLTRIVMIGGIDACKVIFRSTSHSKVRNSV